MKTIVTLILACLFTIPSCAATGLKVKLSPEYQGVNPRVQSLVDEFMWLSKQNHITFTKKVTLGFKKINVSPIVGLCTAGIGFREIDIDIDFWNNSTKTQRLATVFHELIHCYCGRAHDYDNGTRYPPTEPLRIAQAKEWRLRGGPKPGRFDDACPTSLMYPVVVDDDCIKTHYNEYVAEMFNRCQPY